MSGSGLGTILGKQSVREKLLSTLLAAVDDLVCCVSVDGRKLLYANPAAEHFFERPLAELIKNEQPWMANIHPDDQAEFENILTELADQREIEQEYRVVRADGDMRWLRERRRVVKNSAGKPVLILGIATEVTKQKKLEESVRQSEARYLTLANNLPLNYVHKDDEGRCVFGNQQYCQTHQKSLEELIGKTDFDLFPPDLAERYREEDRRTIETGETLRGVVEHRSHGGRRGWIQRVKAPSRDADGIIVGVHVMFWDANESAPTETPSSQVIGDS